VQYLIGAIEELHRGITNGPATLRASEALPKSPDLFPNVPGAAFGLPDNAWRELRDIDTTSGLAVATAMPREFGAIIPAPRTQDVIAKLGIEIVRVKETAFLAKENSPALAYWTAENVAPTEAAPTFTTYASTPYQLGAWADVSRRYSVMAEAIEIVLQLLAAAVKAKLNAAVLNGAGTTEPLGVQGTASVGSVSGATFSRAIQASMIDNVTANGLRSYSDLSLVATPAVAQTLRARVLEAGSGRFIIDGGRFDGLPAYESSGLASGTCMVGDFSKVKVLEYGAPTVIINPYTVSAGGTIRISLVGFYDVAVLQPSAFCQATSVS
jgi:HK97 family phage major capsid protein